MRHQSMTILVIAGLIVASCGESIPAPQVVAPGPATLAELRGPWQAQPLVLDPAMRDRIEKACSRDMEMRPGSAALLIDVRGASVATVRMNGGSCDALEIAPDGQVAGAGAGWSGGLERLPRLEGARFAALEKQAVGGGSLVVEGWSVRGRYGTEIASVVIAPANHSLIVATLENGWFGGWWPARPGELGRDGARVPPFFVRGYDSAGVLLDEVGP